MNKAGRDTGMISDPQNPSWLQLLDDGEPFRLLFPVGLVLGILGLVLWPLHIFHFMETYPGLSHSRIMIQGHMTAFVMGFLGTALPRMLEVRSFGAVQTGVAAFILVLLSLLHLFRFYLAGDLLFLLLVGAVLFLFAIRWPDRRDVPPPAFVLVPAGLLCALTGTGLQIAIQTVPGALPTIAFPLGPLLLNHAFLLLPVMGVGAFFIPRFFGLENRQVFPESRQPPPGWARRACFAGACGTIVLITFLLETSGWFRIAWTLRAVTLLLFFIIEVPVFRQSGPTGSLATAVRLSLLSFPVGYLLMAFWPLNQASLAHVVFITGFSLLTFSVSAWVLLGHSGQAGFFKARLWSVGIFVGLLILATVTRITADWIPEIRLTQYAYAALFWIAAVAVWAFRFLPAAWAPDANP